MRYKEKLNLIWDSMDCCVDDIKRELFELRKRGGHLFFVGNGGSAAISIHMSADYMKNCGMRTISLFDPAVMTCFANDYGYENVFSKQLEMHICENDMLVAISSSGMSENIINAIKVAHSRKAKVVTFTGFDESNMARQMGEYNVYVPCKEYGMVESIHNIILQQIVDEMAEVER